MRGSRGSGRGPGPGGLGSGQDGGPGGTTSGGELRQKSSSWRMMRPAAKFDVVLPTHNSKANKALMSH